MKPNFLYPGLIVLFMFCISSLCFSQDVSNLKLKNFRPVSIYKIPQTEVKKAKYSIIDLHSHDYVNSDRSVDEWVKTMDDVGIGKTIILSYATGKKFDSIVARYSRYKNRFDVWCGFDYTGYDKEGWQ